MSPFWTLLELRVIEVVVTTGAISSRQNVTANKPTSSYFTCQMPFLPTVSTVEALKGKVSGVLLFLLQCALAAAQCIVIGPVCLWVRGVCVCVGLLPL